jgi:DNA-binding GntR family transcriptional regulator
MQSANLDVPPLDLSRPANEQIAAVLKDAILSMQLPPGQLMSEKEMGDVFGASRTPVREAFAMLREENLIVTWPSRGTFVSRLSVHQLKSAQFLREAMEVAVVESLCGEGLPEASETALLQNLEEQRRAVEREGKSAFRTLDDQFHATLAEATGLGRVQRAMVREKTVLDRLRVFSLGKVDNMARLHAEHQRIFEAIQAGNAADAVAQLRGHLQLVLDTLSHVVAENGAFFDLDET